MHNNQYGRLSPFAARKSFWEFLRFNRPAVCICGLMVDEWWSLPTTCSKNVWSNRCNFVVLGLRTNTRYAAKMVCVPWCYVAFQYFRGFRRETFRALSYLTFVRLSITYFSPVFRQETRKKPCKWNIFCSLIEWMIIRLCIIFSPVYLSLHFQSDTLEVIIYYSLNVLSYFIFLRHMRLPVCLK